MDLEKLKELRELLPAKYAKTIADKIASKDIDPATVTNVFFGNITNPEIVNIVVSTALDIIDEQKKLVARLDKAIN